MFVGIKDIDQTLPLIFDLIFLLYHFL